MLLVPSPASVLRVSWYLAAGLGTICRRTSRQSSQKWDGRIHSGNLRMRGKRDAAGLQELTGRGISFAELPSDVLAEVRNLVASSADVDAESARALGLR